MSWKAELALVAAAAAATIAVLLIVTDDAFGGPTDRANRNEQVAHGARALDVG